MIPFEVTDEAACIEAFGDDDCRNHRHDDRYGILGPGGLLAECSPDNPAATQRECRCCGYTEFL